MSIGNKWKPTKEEPRFRPKTVFEGAGRTKQEHKDECDLNKIMEKFKATGALPSFESAPPTFADVSRFGDFRETMEVHLKGTRLFAMLSAVDRARFNNRPDEFFKFAAVEDNYPKVLAMTRGEKFANKWVREQLIARERRKMKAEEEQLLLTPKPEVKPPDPVKPEQK